IRIITSFIQIGVVPNCVNLCDKSPAKWQLTLRHADKVGVLANALMQIRQAQINVEEVENIIFAGTRARCARIRLATESKAELVTEINKGEGVIGVTVQRLPE